jgi:uncharacterized protein (TIGR03435 family)
MERILAVLIMGCALTQAQSERPAYEVASIKLNNSDSGNSSSHGSKGQIVFTNVSLKRLIDRAYNVKPFQVTAPDWTDSVHFDISAKYPPDVKDDDRKLMLRTLLEDRFKLAVHKETKEVQGYELVVSKKGFKLKPVEPGSGGTNSRGAYAETLTAKKVSMEGLADYVASNLGKAVVDKTGIPGVYDFEFRWAREDQPSDGTEADAAPSLFTAVEDTVGVRLQAQKVSLTIFVVDHVERMPDEN